MDKDHKWFQMAKIFMAVNAIYMAADMYYKRKKQNAKKQRKEKSIHNDTSRKSSLAAEQIEVNPHQKKHIKIVFTGGP